MDLALSDEEQAIRDNARTFLSREVLPLEAEFLRRQRSGAAGITREELRRLQEAARRFGFWGMGTPEAHGGMNLPAVVQSLLHTELSRTVVPFRFGGEADNVLFEGTPEQQEEYLRPTIEGERISCFALTEPAAGSDAANIATRARRDGSDWVISGEKTFITQGHDADFAIVVAVTDPDKGPRHGSTAFLVDRDMGWSSSPIPVMGWETPASLVLEDVRVPSRNVLGEPGDGFDLAMRWIERGRYVISAQAVGIAERCLQMAIEYAKSRHTFGAPLADRQAIQWMIADSEVDLEAGRWLALRAAWSVDREHGADARHAASVSKLFAASMVNRVVDRALQVHGGMGYTRELPIEHWYRAVRVFRIFEGSDEMQRLIISRDLLRGYTRVGAHPA